MLFYLKLYGNFEKGFNAILVIGKELESSKKKAKGFLPKNKQLAENLTSFWEEFGKLRNFRAISPIGLYSSITDKFSKTVESINDLAKSLNTDFNNWLNSSSFRKIKRLLEKTIDELPEENIRILIETKENLVHKLPWHEWELIQRYSNPNQQSGTITIDFSIPQKKFSITYKNDNDKPKILVILGNDGNTSNNDNDNYENTLGNNQINIQRDKELLNIQRDRELWKNLKARFQDRLEIEFLDKPLREAIYDNLWNQHWDFIYFGGHSYEGNLIINNDSQTHENKLDFEKLNYALNEAVKNGLKVAFFNSCQGLEFIYNLKDKYPIPLTIVHRDFSYDLACQQFLEKFLQSFFDERRNINLALKRARERLIEIEDGYKENPPSPRANWLPVLFQQPSLLPLTLENLNGEPLSALHPSWNKIWTSFPEKLPYIIAALLLVSLASSGLTFGMRSHGLLEWLELKTYDFMMSQRHLLIDEGVDDRILIVAGENKDIAENQTRDNSPSDEKLAEVIEQIMLHQPRYIGLDFYRDEEIGKGHQRLMNLHNKYNNLIGSCWLERDTKVPFGIKKVGFIDLPPDSDGTLRRISLNRPNSANAEDNCKAENYLGVELANQYLLNELNQEEISNIMLKKLKMRINDRGEILIANNTPLLTADNSLYRNINLWGNPILINYRVSEPSKNPFEILTFTDIQKGKINPDLIKDKIKDKIIIIGMILENPIPKGLSNPNLDRHNTPYNIGNSGELMPGVEIVAHVTSQILDVVKDQRVLIGFLSRKQEWLLIWSGFFVGGLSFLTFYRLSGKNKLIVFFITTMSIVSFFGGICFLFLTFQGILLPLSPLILMLPLNNFIILILEEEGWI